MKDILYENTVFNEHEQKDIMDGLMELWIINAMLMSFIDAYNVIPISNNLNLI